MGHVRIYMKTWETNNLYFDEWSEITNDVQSFTSTITEKIESSRYNVGVAQISNVALKLNDYGGKYSTIGTTNSAFPIKQGNTQIKMEWHPGMGDSVCGWAVCGYFKTDIPYYIYQGIISSIGTSVDFDTTTVTYQIMGKHEYLKEVLGELPHVPAPGVPRAIDTYDWTEWYDFWMLDVPSVIQVISGTNDPSAIIKDPLYDWAYLTSFDNTIEMVEGIDTRLAKNMFEMMAKILAFSVSVQFIWNNRIYVRNRYSASTSSAIFYGPYSNVPTDIISIKNYSHGVEKIINEAVFTKEDRSIIRSFDQPSQDIYGVRKQDYSDINFDNNPKIVGFTQALVLQNAPARDILSLTTYLNEKSIYLKLMDMVTIDSPEGGGMPEVSGQWVIFAISTDLAKETKTFELRKV